MPGCWNSVRLTLWFADGAGGPERAHERHRPVEVLGSVHGRRVTPDERHRSFSATCVGQTLDRAGDARFRHGRVCGETLTMSLLNGPSAQSRVTFQPDRCRLASVAELERYETSDPS